MAFDPNKHLIRMQGNKQYLPVAARLVWFRLEHPDWSIVTSPIEINMEKQYAIFSASIINTEGKTIATASKMENVKGFGDYIEKAETGAVGRALAMSGYGTQFAPEFEESIPTFEGEAHNPPPSAGPAQRPAGNFTRAENKPVPPSVPRVNTPPPGVSDQFEREVESAGAMVTNEIPAETDAFDPLRCAECGKPINQSQADYTTKAFKKPLCVNHKQMAERAKSQATGTTF